MYARRRRLMFAALAACTITIYVSCSQPDDVLLPANHTEVTLREQLLPTNPPGLVYEVWVINELGTASQKQMSLGKFTYDNNTKTYLDSTGSARSDNNLFRLDDDIFNWDQIVISVESTTVAVNEPGAIMLIDDVRDPKTGNQMALRFPKSDEQMDTLNLWGASVTFTMESFSDGDRNTNDGSAVWFASYRPLRGSIQDTIDLDTLAIDTFETMEFIPNDPADSMRISLFDVIIDSIGLVEKPFGFDTLSQRKVFARFITDTMFQSDTLPYTITNVDTLAWELGVESVFVYDQLTQAKFRLPEIYETFGWKYKGWVVSPRISPGDGIGTFTELAWNPGHTNHDFMPGRSGGLLTTGTFTSIEVPDDSNPYTNSSNPNRVPQLAGEDFHDNLPGGLVGPLDLVTDDPADGGTVFISLEPKTSVDQTTNFPLIAFARRIPVGDDSVFAETFINDTTSALEGADDIDAFVLKGWTFTSDPQNGFPKVIVEIKRF
ncbi:MAG: hypothetical protein ACE5FH_10575 [Candidatus Zixiibacteriota bacterium]